ncbi:MAG: hypothetical protein KJO80_02720 [Gammaproteobacteria bacterium]|nr:hypothetical protein [Gammaproteobacteria bacterium]
MHTKRIFLLSFLCFLSAAINANGAGTSDDPEYDAATFDAALQRGLSDPKIPFQLQVNCIDQKGIRSMQMFSGGATVWNRRTQVTLPAKTRFALMETLVSQRFSGFKDRYGGSERLEKTEAAARVTCRIHVEIAEMKKSSVQQGGGEQSALLAGLATALLDEAEKHAVMGVTPDNLQDALAKLSSGQLAPQVLQLRLVDLTEEGGNTTGSILQIRGGKMSHQAYSPGISVDSQAWSQLSPDQYPGLLAELQSTQLESLPGNLWSQDQVDFEIQVLGHKKLIIAKPFKRLYPGAEKAAQQRFNSLVTYLRALNS